MRIQHNIAAINSYRNSRSNRKLLNKNLERLSSGYKINRAGDDAAGLAISESLRALINGTRQAENNTQDGIGLIRTAEGAMQEIHAMLERAYEISIKSANSLYNEDNRSIMQEEIEQIQAEISRITDNTDFNGIKVLQGQYHGGIEDVKIRVDSELPAWVKTFQAMADGQMTEVYNTTEDYTDSSGNITSYTLRHAAGTLDFSDFDGSALKKNELAGTGFYSTCYTCNKHYSINFTTGTANSKEQSGSHIIYNIGVDSLTNADDLVKAIIDITDSGYPDSHYTKLVQDPAIPGKLIVYDDRCMDSRPAGTDTTGTWDHWNNPYFETGPDQMPENGKFGSGVAESAGITVDGEGDIQYQIGSSQSEILQVKLPNTSNWSLGITGASVSTQSLANHSIKTILGAIDYLSGERGRMGAYDNRLEHAYQSLTNTRENLSSAESRIRDTNMAEEITSYTKNNIILQAAQSMLAQANSIPQNILSLLQS